MNASVIMDDSMFLLVIKGGCYVLLTVRLTRLVTSL